MEVKVACELRQRQKVRERATSWVSHAPKLQDVLVYQEISRQHANIPKKQNNSLPTPLNLQ